VTPRPSRPSRLGPWTPARKARLALILAALATLAVSPVQGVLAGLEASGVLGWPWWAVMSPGLAAAAAWAVAAAAGGWWALAARWQARRSLSAVPDTDTARSLRDGKTQD